MLHSLGRRKNRVERTSLAHVKRLLCGIDEATIESATNKLVGAKLIRIIPQEPRFHVDLLPLTDKHRQLFDVAEDEDAPNDSTVNPQKPTFRHVEDVNVFNFCRSKDIPLDTALRITRLVAKAELWLDQFVHLSGQAEQEHFRNVMRGRFNSSDGEIPHHGTLLVYKLNEIIKLRSQPAPKNCAEATWEEMNREMTEEEKEQERPLQLDIDADPLHAVRRGFFDENDIVKRVALDGQNACRVLRRIGKHILRHCESITTDYQNAVNLNGELGQEILAHALNYVNAYYKREVKATLEEFETALNVELSRRNIETLELVRRETDPIPNREEKGVSEESIESDSTESEAVSEFADASMDSFVDQWAKDLRHQMAGL